MEKEEKPAQYSARRPNINTAMAGAFRAMATLMVPRAGIVTELLCELFMTGILSLRVSLRWLRQIPFKLPSR